jgi:hypothetical protein
MLVYLDHNATTPLAPEVLDAVTRAQRDLWGNPSSPHALGVAARRALEEARAQVAALLSVTPEEVIFTSGGTESDNAAVLGVAEARPERRHVVISAVEHAAVAEPARRLAERGWRVSIIPVRPSGVVDLEALTAVLTGIFLSHYWVDWMSEGLTIGLAAGLASVWSWPGDAQEASGLPLEQTVEKRLQELANRMCSRLVSGMRQEEQSLAKLPAGTLTVDVLQGSVTNSSGLAPPPSLATELARWFRRGCEAHRIELSQVSGVQVQAEFTTGAFRIGRKPGISIHWKCSSRIETGLTSFQAQSAERTFVQLRA